MARRMPGRTSEQDLLLPTLALLAAEETGHLTTSQLIARVTKVCNPTGADAEILDNRSDTRFSQIVRSMISHKTARGNIIGRGFAREVGRGLQITPAGREYLALHQQAQASLAS